jgi:Na+-transporting methylmalonyl-CoA/oxaloacetate decarboxylase gamma subunit
VAAVAKQPQPVDELTNSYGDDFRSQYPRIISPLKSALQSSQIKGSGLRSVTDLIEKFGKQIIEQAAESINNQDTAIDGFKAAATEVALESGIEALTTFGTNPTGADLQPSRDNEDAGVSAVNDTEEQEIPNPENGDVQEQIPDTAIENPLEDTTGQEHKPANLPQKPNSSEPSTPPESAQTPRDEMPAPATTPPPVSVAPASIPSEEGNTGQVTQPENNALSEAVPPSTSIPQTSPATPAKNEMPTASEPQPDAQQTPDEQKKPDSLPEKPKPEQEDQPEEKPTEEKPAPEPENDLPKMEKSPLTETEGEPFVPTDEIGQPLNKKTNNPPVGQQNPSPNEGSPANQTPTENISPDGSTNTVQNVQQNGILAQTANRIRFRKILEEIDKRMTNLIKDKKEIEKKIKNISNEIAPEERKLVAYKIAKWTLFIIQWLLRVLAIVLGITIVFLVLVPLAQLVWTLSSIPGTAKTLMNEKIKKVEEEIEKKTNEREKEQKKLKEKNSEIGKLAKERYKIINQSILK